MDWNAIGTEFVIGLLGLIITALGLVITNLINKYIKNEDLKAKANSLHEIVKVSVLDVYQTFVEELKANGTFDENAQKTAFKRCLDLIKTNMPQQVKKWLETNYSDIEGYLKTLIEAQIGALKNNAKGGN